jgi:hypothetical protein
MHQSLWAYVQELQRFFPISWVTCWGIQSNKFNFHVIFVCIFVLHICRRMCSIKLSSLQQLLVLTVTTGSVLKPWIDPAPAYFPVMAVLGVFIPYLAGLLQL